jgi:hypothetical protein
LTIHALLPFSHSSTNSHVREVPVNGVGLINVPAKVKYSVNSSALFGPTNPTLMALPHETAAGPPGDLLFLNNITVRTQFAKSVAVRFDPLFKKKANKKTTVPEAEDATAIALNATTANIAAAKPVSR